MPTDVKLLSSPSRLRLLGIALCSAWACAATADGRRGNDPTGPSDGDSEPFRITFTETSYHEEEALDGTTYPYYREVYENTFTETSTGTPFDWGVTRRYSGLEEWPADYLTEPDSWEYYSQHSSSRIHARNSAADTSWSVDSGVLRWRTVLRINKISGAPFEFYLLHTKAEIIHYSDGGYSSEIPENPADREYHQALFVRDGENLTRDGQLLPVPTGPIRFEDGPFQYGTAELLKVDIVPDYDRDGVIRKEAWTDDDGKVHPSDYHRAAAGETFRFWFNNDDDADAVGGPDIPGSVIHTGDSISSKVDGIRDLLDFFPLSINFHGLLDTMDLSKVKVQFAGPGVNWIEFDDQYIGISESLVNIHHSIETFAEDWSSATTVWGGPASSLSERMLERIRDGREVLLLEGRGPSTEPLMMEFSYDGKLLFKKEVPISLHPVEEMYRHLNLIHSLGPQEGPDTAMGDPAGLPDAETNGKRFAFVHGYNVNAAQSRGWNGEMFKRLYQSGSNAQYIAVYWWGYESQIDTLVNGYKTPNYYKTAINAFQSAPLLASGLGDGANTTIAAHSLGNMLVSSAIADHGFAPEKYFLINAAVAMEAYDGTADETANMRNENWWGDQSDEQYDPRLYSANWHELFSSSDARSQLTWRNRFGALSQAYNFYSSGDQVFENGDGVEPAGWNGFWDGAKTWYSQEYDKGRGFLRDLPSNGPTIRVHGGWGFDGVGYYGWDALQAAGISDSQLRFSPFFLPFEDEDPNYPDSDGSLLFAPDDDPAASTPQRFKKQALKRRLGKF